SSLQVLRITSPRVAKAFAEMARDSDPSIRRSAMLGLSDIDDQHAITIPVLAAALDDPDSEVRLMAAQGLWHASEAKDAVPALIRALQSPSASVRGLAVEALGKNAKHAKSAIPAVTRALDDPDETVRKGAARTLKLIEEIKPKE